MVLDRFWRPNIHKEVIAYVRSCKGCQFATPLPHYRSSLYFPLTNIFSVFSIDFAGPFPASSGGNRFILVCVEHLTGWPLARAIANATADVVKAFVREEIMHSFGPPQTIISDNATCFTATSISQFMEESGIEWRTVLAYAPMSNGRAERMVGTVKRGVKKMVLDEGIDWDQALTHVLYGYRRRPLAGGASPFELLYGVTPRMGRDKVSPCLSHSVEDRRIELLAVSAGRVKRIVDQREIRKGPLRSKQTQKFQVGDLVLVAHGKALNPAVKWPAFKSVYYGPCRVVRESHPRYSLVSSHGRTSRKDIHARRLVKYQSPTTQ